jgi:hypothetical protein
MKRIGLAISAAVIFTISHANAENTGFPDCSTFPAKLLSADDLLKFSKKVHKGEYETTEAYESRIRSALPQGTVAVTQKVDPSGTIFDADTGALTIPEYDLPQAMKIIETDGSFVGWLAPVFSQRMKTGRYIGQNGFGAKTVVTREEEANIGLAWVRDSGPHFNPDADIKIAMTPEKARKYRQDLGVFLVGTLVKPYVARATTFDEATLDDPTELTVGLVGITVAPICTGVYSRKTHEVLFSWPAGTGQKLPYMP